MRIHVRSTPARVKRKNGDQKMIKGVLHERINTMTLIRCYDEVTGDRKWRLSYLCNGGRQNHEWVPVEELIGNRGFRRRHFVEIDGERK